MKAGLYKSLKDTLKAKKRLDSETQQTKNRKENIKKAFYYMKLMNKNKK